MKYRIIEDTFNGRFYIQRKFLWMWAKWEQHTNDERWSGTNRCHWGFSSARQAEEHLATFLAEEEHRRIRELQEKSKNRMVSVKEIVIK